MVNSLLFDAVQAIGWKEIVQSWDRRVTNWGFKGKVPFGDFSPWAPDRGALFTAFCLRFTSAAFWTKKENLSSSVSPWSHFVWQRPERRSFEVFGIVFLAIDSLEEFWIHCFAIDTRQLTFSFFCFNKAGATTINEACFVWTFPEKEWMVGQSSSLCLCMVFGPIQVWKNTEACSFRSLLLIIRQTDIVGSFSPTPRNEKIDL